MTDLKVYSNFFLPYCQVLHEYCDAVYSQLRDPSQALHVPHACSKLNKRFVSNLMGLKDLVLECITAAATAATDVEKRFE